jgi:glycosyltransferase involved in cell wall biosynthesis
MNLQVLVSTMNQTEISGLIKDMKIKSSYVVINQVTKLKTLPLKVVDKSGMFLSFYERGLSRSRNRALENSNADICVIADDDMYYTDDYQDTILSAYKQYPDADIIAFFVDNENTAETKPVLAEGRLGLLKTMKLASWQITFKKSSVQDKDICFDTNFGTGTEMYMGEENIFLFDCWKKGLSIYYVPKKIAVLREDSVSTWFEGYNEKYFIVKGEAFRRMAGSIGGIFLCLQFVIRKYNIYKNEISLLKATKLILKGSK